MNKDTNLFFNSFYFAPIGMALVGLNGEWLDTNPALSKIIGYNKSELVHKTFQDITHPDDLMIDLNYVKQMLDRKIETYQMEKRYFHKEGNIVWVMLSVSLVHDENKEPKYFISQIVDITKQKETELELLENEARFRLIAENSSDMISKHKKDGTVIYVSPACKKILGYTTAELEGKSAYELFSPEDLYKVKGSNQKLINNQEISSFSYRCLRKDGLYIWLETTSQTIRNKQGKVETIIAVTRDITTRKQEEFKLIEMNEKLQYISETDGLTGIPNRRSLDSQLKKLSLHNYAIILLDVDNFKIYNDTFGHLAGDDCLKTIANSIKDLAEEQKYFVARYGGEEFAVVMPDTSAEKALEVAEKIRGHIGMLNIPHEKSLGHVTISCGVYATESKFKLLPAEVVEFADQALYRAKKSGRNKCVYFNNSKETEIS